MNDPFPPEILIREGPVWRKALFVGVSQGLPAYDIPLPEDRLTADTNRALDLIGKALKPSEGVQIPNEHKNAWECHPCEQKPISYE